MKYSFKLSNLLSSLKSHCVRKPTTTINQNGTTLVEPEQIWSAKLLECQVQSSLIPYANLQTGKVKHHLRTERRQLLMPICGGVWQEDKYLSEGEVRQFTPMAATQERVYTDSSGPWLLV